MSTDSGHVWAQGHSRLAAAAGLVGSKAIAGKVGTIKLIHDKYWWGNKHNPARTFCEHCAALLPFAPADSAPETIDAWEKRWQAARIGMAHWGSVCTDPRVVTIRQESEQEARSVIQERLGKSREMKEALQCANFLLGCMLEQPYRFQGRFDTASTLVMESEINKRSSHIKRITRTMVRCVRIFLEAGKDIYSLRTPGQALARKRQKEAYKATLAEKSRESNLKWKTKEDAKLQRQLKAEEARLAKERGRPGQLLLDSYFTPPADPAAAPEHSRASPAPALPSSAPSLPPATQTADRSGRPPVAPKPKPRRNWPAPKPAPPPPGRDIRSFLRELGASSQGPLGDPTLEESLEETFYRHTRQYSSEKVETLMGTLSTPSMGRYILDMLGRLVRTNYATYALEDFSVELHLPFGDVSTDYMPCLSYLGVTWGDALKKVGYSLEQWTHVVDDAKSYFRPEPRYSPIAPASFRIADIGDRVPLPNYSRTSKVLRARLPTSEPVVDGNYYQDLSTAGAVTALSLSPLSASATDMALPGGGGSGGEGGSSIMILSDVVVQVSQHTAGTQASQGATGLSTSGSLSSSLRASTRQKKAIGKGLPITGYFSKTAGLPSPDLPSVGEDEVSVGRDPPLICSVAHPLQLMPRPTAQRATPSGRWFPIFQRPTRLPTGVASGASPASLSPGAPSSAESPCLDMPLDKPSRL